ncbi:MAG: hypothetical protein JRF63_02420 [Deltaproteobacteria bacterium]|nr:hypothetical protein [Deltaproteobacteria bacterium]
MLAVICPNCSSPAPVSLADPDNVACEHCSQRSPIPDKVRGALREAAEEIGKLDARERQLDAKQRRAISKSSRYQFLILGLGLTMALPGVLHWMGVLMDLTRVVVAEIIFLSLMSVALVAATWFGIWSIRRARRKMEVIAAAQPPVADGGAVRCRVCGGELPDLGSAIATCTFCRADNIVSPGVLEQSKQARDMVLDNYGDTVADNARQIGRHSGLASLWVGLAAFGVPVVILIAYQTWAVLAGDEIDLEREYAVWAVGDRSCLGEVQRAPDRATALYFGRLPVPGMAQTQISLPSTEGLVLLRADQMLGRTVYREADGAVDTVIKVKYNALVEENLIEMSDFFSQSIIGTCFAEIPPGPPPAQ